MKALARNAKALPALAAIGQRFNAFYGTYLLLGSRDGFAQLRQLGEVVDGMAKTYAKPGAPAEIEATHLALVLRAARAAFAILRDMRDGRSLTPTVKTEATEVRRLYLALEGVHKRQGMSQTDVDSMLDTAKGETKKAG